MLRVLLEGKGGAPRHPERPPNIQHRILWAPAHSGIAGDIHADWVARGYTKNLSLNDSDLEEPTPVHTEYSPTLAYNRGIRKRYPPPHESLKRAGATDWKKLQTGTLPKLLSKIYPTQYADAAPLCNNPPPCTSPHWNTNTQRLSTKPNTLMRSNVAIGGTVGPRMLSRQDRFRSVGTRGSRVRWSPGPRVRPLLNSVRSSTHGTRPR